MLIAAFHQIMAPMNQRKGPNRKASKVRGWYHRRSRSSSGSMGSPRLRLNKRSPRLGSERLIVGLLDDSVEYLDGRPESLDVPFAQAAQLPR